MKDCFRDLGGTTKDMRLFEVKRRHLKTGMFLDYYCFK